MRRASNIFNVISSPMASFLLCHAQHCISLRFSLQFPASSFFQYSVIMGFFCVFNVLYLAHSCRHKNVCECSFVFIFRNIFITNGNKPIHIVFFFSCRLVILLCSIGKKWNETHVCHLQILQRMLDLAASLNTNKNGMKTRKALRSSCFHCLSALSIFCGISIRLDLFNIFSIGFAYFCPSLMHRFKYVRLFVSIRSSSQIFFLRKAIPFIWMYKERK